MKNVSVSKEPQFKLEYYAENPTKFLRIDTADQNKTNEGRDFVEILTTWGCNNVMKRFGDV